MRGMSDSREPTRARRCHAVARGRFFFFLALVLGWLFTPFQALALEDRLVELFPGGEGRQVGLEFGPDGSLVGNLWFADGSRGVFVWNREGRVETFPGLKLSGVAGDGRLLGCSLQGASSIPAEFAGVFPAGVNLCVEKVNRSGQAAAWVSLEDEEQVLFWDGDVLRVISRGRRVRLIDLNDRGELLYRRGAIERPEVFLYAGGESHPLLPPGPGYLVATDINNHGQVAGHWQKPNRKAIAMLWQDGELELLPQLANAYRINDAGVAVGYYYDGRGIRHEGLLEGGARVDLTALLGPDFFVVGLGEEGQLTGWKQTGAQRWQAFRTR